MSSAGYANHGRWFLSLPGQLDIDNTSAPRGMPLVTITPTAYSQPPVKPARRKPVTTGGQRRMSLHINPVR
jgi:hypothetical protein